MLQRLGTSIRLRTDPVSYFLFTIVLLTLPPARVINASGSIPALYIVVPAVTLSILNVVSFGSQDIAYDDHCNHVRSAVRIGPSQTVQRQIEPHRQFLPLANWRVNHSGSFSLSGFHQNEPTGKSRAKDFRCLSPMKAAARPPKLTR